MFKQLIDLYELLDTPHANGQMILDYLDLSNHKSTQVTIETISSAKGSTDFIRIFIPGTNGKSLQGDSPTLGIIGRLGGIGARPERIGFVSDGDGALAALAVAAKLNKMSGFGDHLAGDVIISTHICPNAPTRPHQPVPFMDSPVDMQTMNQKEVDEQMDAILSIDTTKGNNVINHKGFALSPTVKEGYILPVSADLLALMSTTTGDVPYTFPLSQQDITPYENRLNHINSILQPATSTASPVVGVAITTKSAVAGCATGASHLLDIEVTARFVLEVAKAFGENSCRFFDQAEFDALIEYYGSMNHFQQTKR